MVQLGLFIEISFQSYILISMAFPWFLSFYRTLQVFTLEHVTDNRHCERKSAHGGVPERMGAHFWIFWNRKKFLLLGFEPRTPAWQASALSITPCPLDQNCNSDFLLPMIRLSPSKRDNRGTRNFVLHLGVVLFERERRQRRERNFHRREVDRHGHHPLHQPVDPQGPVQPRLHFGPGKDVLLPIRGLRFQRRRLECP